MIKLHGVARFTIRDQHIDGFLSDPLGPGGLNAHPHGGREDRSPYQPPCDLANWRLGILTSEAG
jgi:hypothetical protein